MQILNVNILISTPYKGLGGHCMTILEGWTFLDGFYYGFISLTTIGFGDFYPVESFNDVQSFKGIALAGFNICYCIFGMTLLSMILALVQEQMVEKASRSAKKNREEEEEFDKFFIIERKEHFGKY